MFATGSHSIMNKCMQEHSALLPRSNGATAESEFEGRNGKTEEAQQLAEEEEEEEQQKQQKQMVKQPDGGSTKANGAAQRQLGRPQRLSPGNEGWQDTAPRSDNNGGSGAVGKSVFRPSSETPFIDKTVVAGVAGAAGGAAAAAAGLPSRVMNAFRAGQLLWSSN